MLLAIIPIIFVIVGGLLWGLTSGKIAEVGRLTFLAGMIALAMTYASHNVHFSM